MDISGLMGSLAAILTTVSFVPQVLKTLHTGSTEGISILMYSTFVMGILLWLVYGILKNDPPIYLANSLTLVLATVVLTIKIINIVRGKEK